MLGWMKSMRTMYGKEEKQSKGKSGAAPPILTDQQRWVLDTVGLLRPNLKVRTKRRVLSLIHILFLFIIMIHFP